MKTKLILAIACALTVQVNLSGQEQRGMFSYFFKPRPVEQGMGLMESPPIWEFKPTVQIPAIKVTESVRDGAQLDATFLASTGGGITLQKTIEREKKNYAIFSWSPVIILLTGDTSKDNPLDLSYCTTIGFFNNLIQFGAGWDFGVVEERSRFFGVLSLGINITNN